MSNAGRLGQINQTVQAISSDSVVNQISVDRLRDKEPLTQSSATTTVTSVAKDYVFFKSEVLKVLGAWDVADLCGDVDGPSSRKKSRPSAPDGSAASAAAAASLSAASVAHAKLHATLSLYSLQTHLVSHLQSSQSFPLSSLGYSAASLSSQCSASSLSSSVVGSASLVGEMAAVRAAGLLCEAAAGEILAAAPEGTPALQRTMDQLVRESRERDERREEDEAEVREHEKILKGIIDKVEDYKRMNENRMRLRESSDKMSNV